MSKEKTKDKAKIKAKQPGLTPKQAMIKVGTLIKGIDNSSTMIEKHQAVINGNVKQLGNIISGLSNQESQKGEAAQPKVKVKVKVKPTAEKVKTAQPKAKPSNGAGPKATVKGRPTIKDAVLEFVHQDGPDTKANLYHKAINKYGYWSRQSFYQAMKDKKSFKTTDGKIHAVLIPIETKTSDADAKKFVEKVEADQSVATMA